MSALRAAMMDLARKWESDWVTAGSNHAAGAIRNCTFELYKALRETPDVEAKTIPARRTDPGTSHQATEQIKVRAGTQRAYLLEAFAWADRRNRYGGALTDEEAAELGRNVALNSEYAKRCSELRAAGFIEPTGETRPGSSGMERIVSRITDKGYAWVRENL